uniref:Uncharacterized protein n=1 Tax=Arabidopsis thaliana TaxID=3702 RepID=Q9LTN3_ARATH|nr:unnamed protein product [Arabidopsis thaliana]
MPTKFGTTQNQPTFTLIVFDDCAKRTYFLATRHGSTKPNANPQPTSVSSSKTQSVQSSPNYKAFSSPNQTIERSSPSYKAIFIKSPN